MTKKITSIFIALSILGSFVVPVAQQPAQAAEPGTVARFVGCYAAGKLTPAIDRKLDDEIKGVRERIDNLKKGALKSALQFLFGKPAESILGTVPVSDKKVGDGLADYIATYTNKNYRDNVIARCLTREILEKLTSNFETIVRTGGRDGGSTAILNWINFQTQAEYRGENIFRAQLSTAKLCNYLSDDFKRSYGVDPNKRIPLTGQNTRTGSLESFSVASRCTMPANFNLQNYQKDFVGNGGWEAYSRMLEPQNNAWGLSLLSQNEITKQRALQKEADVNQAIAGSGYLGISGNGKNDSCRVKGPTGECLIYKDIKTTGTYLAQGLSVGLNAQYSWLIDNSATGNIISLLAANLTQSLLNKFMNFNNPSQGGVGSVTFPTTTPGPPIPPDPEDVCFTDDAQRSSIASIMSSSVSVINKLSPNDFFVPPNAPGGAPRAGDVSGVIGSFLTRMTALYGAMFNIEKGLTGTTNGELKQLVQSLGSIIESSITRIKDPNFAWKTDLEKIKVEKGLLEEKTSNQEAITLINIVPICGTTPPGGGGTTPPGGASLPNLLSVVQQVHKENPSLITDGCAVVSDDPNNDSKVSYKFIDAVISRIRQNDTNAAYNGKRGNITDLSTDAISYYFGSGTPATGSNEVYVVDVIGSQCGTTSSPQWNDVTLPGVLGAYVYPRP